MRPVQNDLQERCQANHSSEGLDLALSRSCWPLRPSAGQAHHQGRTKRITKRITKGANKRITKGAIKPLAAARATGFRATAPR